MNGRSIDGEIRVCVNRRLAFAVAVFFGVILFGALSRAVTTDNIEAAVIVVIFIGIPFGYYMRRTFQRRPVLVLDGRALTIGRSRQVIPWDTVFEAHLRQRQSIFGVYHHLVLTVQPSADHQDKRSLAELTTSKVAVQTVRQPIDQLSMSWSDIMALVRQRLGKEIPTRHEAGLFGETRTSS
jgi:hypothetical protein